MPFVDIQGKLGIPIDKWLLHQSAEQPYRRAANCHTFEKEWIECSDGLGKIRARKECKIEFEDFYECMHRDKTNQRLYEIRKQRDKMIKEGSYTPPAQHSGKEDQRP